MIDDNGDGLEGSGRPGPTAIRETDLSGRYRGTRRDERSALAELLRRRVDPARDRQLKSVMRRRRDYRSSSKPCPNSPWRAIFTET
jgi:hypothetical protein